MIAVVSLTYWRALSGGFIWDDFTYLVNSPVLTASDGLWRLWTDRTLPDFWPVSYSLLWLEYHAFGLQVEPYHAVSLALHLGNVLLIWRILRHLGCRHAGAAAMLFSLHPVNVEAVAWIFQTKTLLASSFALAALLVYLKARAGSGAWRYAAALGLFVLAMGAKAAVVCWPVAMAICAALHHRQAFVANWRQEAKQLAPFFLAAGVLAAINLWWYAGAGPGATADSELIRTDGVLSHVLIGARAFWFYLSKAVWPYPLSFVYTRWPTTTDGAAWMPLVAIAVAAAAVVRWRRIPAVATAGWGLSYYLVTLLPVLGVYDIYFMRYSFVADHWQYLSLAAPCALAAHGAGAALAKRPGLAALLPGLVAGLFAVLSYKQSLIYRDEETIWRDTLSKNDGSWMVHNSLGLALKRQGHLAEALAEYQRAAQLQPQAQSFYNIGLIYDQQGLLHEALAQYRQALALNPNYHIIYTNTGVVLAKLGRLAEAKASFETALALAATAQNHYNLGLLLADSGDLASARQHLAEAVRLAPENAAFRSQLAKLSAGSKGP